MTEHEIRAIVERVLRGMPSKVSPAKDASEAAAPGHSAESESLPDIMQTDLRHQYLVSAPHDQAAFLSMKERTPHRRGARGSAVPDGNPAALPGGSRGCPGRGVFRRA